MADYIDRHTIIESIHSAIYPFICGAEDGDELSEAEKLVLSVNKAICTAIKAMPSADAIEVVRCWNCVWWDNCPSSTITPNFHKCKRVGRMSMPSDGFCSFGERKDG